MKKKIIGVFVCMLLIITIIPIVSSIDKNIENNDYISDEIIVDDDCGCGNSNGAGYRFEIMEERSKPLNTDETFVKPTVMDDLPEYFNWMDFEGQDWTTPAKNQNWPKSCGSCWDFAALGTLESIINIREGRANLDVDLSEQYVLSCLPRAGDCIGGSSYNTFYYIMCNRSSGNNCNGITPEFCFPYQADDDIPCSDKCPDWEDYLIPISDFGRWYPNGSAEDRDAIKTQIMQKGPVATAMKWTYYLHEKDNFLDWGLKNHDPDDYFSSSLQFDTTDHIVVIVGWKDDPMIGNGGYWICKNEWGTFWGFNGFFNIEYGSLGIDNSEIDWVDYNPDVMVNWAPVANAGGIYYGDVGHEVMFDASGSFDHEGEIVSYEWDFGDGNNGYGVNVTHIYEFQGGYPVTLTVIDIEGNTENDTTWVFIGRLNAPPNTPTVDGPPKGKIGIKYDYNFSAIDPDGDDVYYFIYWGDLWAEMWIGPYSSGEIVTVNHTWNDKSTFTMSVKAKDSYDFKSDWATLEVTMPKNKQFNLNLNLLSWLFERFPNAFPILKHLLDLIGD